ncbi:hypothetical protein EV651_104198 [Kribbella sp. VKM Ac-2571]|uniref:hypothetical protein n=1 Tax=Kribbella sp. VKM Ac-2571 TaxID=2512222 RepID=UPI00105EB5D6|nr:hypothetical protein [Kribbella sp. VKM Ac-2571]TDO66631.1 hypothetical protein EV651_104198 [Kribbella sp. VKM Ac-2571]
MSPLRLLLRRVALLVACLAPVPYVVLKLLWLSGSTLGTTSDAGVSEMHETRFVVGNAITVLLMLVAVAFAIALTRSWARSVPAWLVFVLGAGATGLLAPILLGLPLGVVIQLVANGAVKPADDTGLAPWVFGTVYTGFGLLGIAIAVLLAEYVVARWDDLISAPPQPPSTVLTVAGAVGLLPFGAANLYWGIFGPGSSGPQGMDLPAQRTVLVVTGILCLAAFVQPFSFKRTRRPRIAWLVTWSGCCVAAFQGPTQVLLAEGGDVQPMIAVLALLGTPGSCLYGLGVLRRRTNATLAAAPSAQRG